MDFSFAVGTRERHQVHFHFNQVWGNLRIDVDGRPVVKDFRMFSVRTRVTYEFLVGSAERHEVRIEKTRKRLLGGARKQTYRIFVDGKPIRGY